MSKPKPPDPAKLFLSAIYFDSVAMDKCLDSIMAKFGPTDFSSREILFNATAYYHAEMGEPLYRRFFAFKELVDPADLIEIKLFTNSKELETSVEGNRKVNLDPGIISMNNLILATGKPGAHRPYLGRGIYADLTLIFEHGSFQSLPWTYPDYKGRDLIAFLNRIRESYKTDLKDVEKKEDMWQRSTA